MPAPVDPLPDHLSSQRGFEAYLSAVELRLQACWSNLAAIRDGPTARLAQLQPELAALVFDLSTDYHAIARYRRRLVERKARLDETWFRKRQATLTNRQRALTDAITMARCIGDAFAWFFYQDDPALLERHGAHPLQPALADGVGGLGEAAFAANVPAMHGKIVVHHAITSILRLGDVSLASLPDHKIDAIGELKTTKLGDGRINVRLTLSVTGRADEESFNFEPAMPPPEHPPELPPYLRARLQQQMQRLDEVVKWTPKVRFNRDSSDQTHADACAALVDRTRHGQMHVEQVDNGTLLFCYRPYRSGLAHKLLRQSWNPRKSDLDRLVRNTKDIVLGGSNHNYVIFDSLQFDRNGHPHSMPGMPPLFWWLPSRTAHQIVLREVLVGTIFNPAHIFASLEREGWRVSSPGHPAHAVLTLQKGARTVRLDGADYYLRLAQHSLCTEHHVISLMRLAVEQTEPLVHDSGSARIFLTHRPFPRPSDP